MRVVPDISFNGDCEEAPAFYQRAMGGSVDLIWFDTFGVHWVIEFEPQEEHQ